MEIRKADLNDFNELLKLKLESKEEERKFNNSLKPVEDVKDYYRTYLRNDLGSDWRAVFIAEDNNSMIGLAVGKIYRTLMVAGYERSGYLSNVYVKKEYRRKGVAFKLTKEILKWFKQKGAVNVTLEIYPDNTAAEGLYKKFGFKNHSSIMKSRIK